MADARQFRHGPRLWLSCLTLCCVAMSGCVERRMTIRSNPPGAVVYVDNNQIGTTPVSTSFTYYGTRTIRLVKDGYETLTVLQPIPVPWYQITPIDFFAENVVPGDIRDNRTFDFQLTPQRVVPPEQLLERAEGLRQQTRGSGVVQTSPPRTAGPYPAGNVPSSSFPSASPWPAASPATPAPQTQYQAAPPGGWHMPGQAQ